MKLNSIKNFSIFIIFVFCFVAHFLYDLFPSFLTSIFFPVNESVWEHMKMLVSSIIVWEVILFFVFKKNNYYFSNFLFSVLCTCISSVLIFLIMYYPLYFLFGDHFIINIVLLFISIFISVNIGFKILNMDDFNFEFISLILIVFMYIIFGFFTYIPPKYPIFMDPRDNSFGISFD